MSRIGLLFADKSEVPDRVLWKIGKLETYKESNHDLGVVVSGIGKENAAASTEILCAEFKPDYIISLGVCGGAQQAFKIGEILIADWAYYNGGKIKIQSPYLEQFKAVLSASPFPYHVGGFQMFDKFIFNREDARDLLADAAGVDMESYAIVEQANKKGVSAIIAKAISDIVPEKKSDSYPCVFLAGYVSAKKTLDHFFRYCIPHL